MKKVLFCCLVCLFVGVMGFSQLPLKDVPPNHWAYESVKYLLEAGIISGMTDGTFQGTSNTTRYQLAVSLYRTVEYLKTSLPYLKAENIAGLMTQIDGTKSLVDSLARNVENMGSQVQKVNSQLTAVTNDISELKALRNLIGGWEGRIVALERDVPSLQNSVSTMQGTVYAVQDKVTRAENDMRNVQTETATVKKEINDIRLEISTYGQRIKSVETLVGGISSLELKNSISRVSDDISKVKADQTQLKSSLDAQVIQLADHKKQIDTISQEIPRMKIQIGNVETRISESGMKMDNIAADYEAFKSDILPKVSKNSSDIINLNRKLQDMDVTVNTRLDAVERKITLPTWLGVGGIVLGIAGIGMGVFSLFSLQALIKSLEEESSAP